MTAVLQDLVKDGVFSTTCASRERKRIVAPSFDIYALMCRAGSWFNGGPSNERYQGDSYIRKFGQTRISFHPREIEGLDAIRACCHHQVAVGTGGLIRPRTDSVILDYSGN